MKNQKRSCFSGRRTCIPICVYLKYRRANSSYHHVSAVSRHRCLWKQNKKQSVFNLFTGLLFFAVRGEFQDGDGSKALIWTPG